MENFSQSWNIPIESGIILLPKEKMARIWTILNLFWRDRYGFGTCRRMESSLDMADYHADKKFADSNYSRV